MKNNLLAYLCISIFSIYCCGNLYSQKETNTTTIHNLDNATAISYEDINGLIVIELQINKSKLLKFILDTGAPKTFVFESDRSQGYNEPLSKSSKIKYHIENHSDTSVRFVDGCQIKVGNITLKNVSVGALPSKQFFGNASYTHIPYDGVIGYDLLQFAAFEINRKNHTLTFHKPNNYSLSKEWTFSTIELREKKPYCFVNFRIKPEDKPMPLKLHFDLGNMGSTWLKTDSIKGILPPAGKEKVLGKWLNGELQTGVLWPVHELKVANKHSLWGELIKFIPAGHPDDLNQKGNIGSKTLQHFDLLIDYTYKKIATRPLNKAFLLKREALNLYTGEFSSDDFPRKVVLKEKGGLLYSHVGGQNPLPLTALSTSEFIFKPADISVLFLKTEGEKINYNSFIVKQKGKQYLFKKK